MGSIATYRNSLKTGNIEIWELYNKTPDTHPIHLHLVTFQILDRAPFTVKDDGTFDVGSRQEPDLNEMGWKDTVRANPNEVTRIIARFGPFTGIYPWHCHILEHEDHDMMRPYEVLANPTFNPSDSIPGQCPDDSFAQCFDCDNKVLPDKSNKHHSDSESSSDDDD